MRLIRSFAILAEGLHRVISIQKEHHAVHPNVPVPRHIPRSAATRSSGTHDGIYGYNSHALTVLAPDLRTRLFTAAVVDADAGGRTHAVAARVLGNAGPSVVYGGRMNFSTLEMHLHNPVQASRAGTACGFYAVAAALDIGQVPGLPVITSPLTADATVGIPFSYTVTASGASPLTITATGLPGWLTLDGAVLSGTPVVPAGSVTVTVGASNAVGSASRALVITVHQPGAPLLSGPLAATGMVGQPFTFTLAATGSQPLIISATPLPGGLTLQGSLISGTPTEPGITSVGVIASNTVGEDHRELILTILGGQGSHPSGAGAIRQGGGNCGLGAWATVLMAAVLACWRLLTVRDRSR